MSKSPRSVLINYYLVVNWGDLQSLGHVLKGIRFIVLYPPKRSHDFPPLLRTMGCFNIQGEYNRNKIHIFLLIVELPDSIKAANSVQNFKTQLKTLLFRK